MLTVGRDGSIQISRGDSFFVPLFINEGTDLEPIRYELNEGDLVYVGVMEPNQPFEKAIIKKVYNKDSEKTEFGDLLLIFDVEDTEYLHQGQYYYSVKIKRGDKVDTLIPERNFIIL